MTATEDVRSEIAQSDQLPEEARASDLATATAGMSVLLALYEFYVRGNRERGIFIGHWAPTILAFAIYLRKRRDQ